MAFVALIPTVLLSLTSDLGAMGGGGLLLALEAYRFS